MIIPHYYEDPHTLHVGTMPNRAYYIPASRRSDALVEHRETSDRFQLLNGSWKFRYYASIYDLQDAFYGVGYDASAFDSIPVPSVWQNHGYDHHQYTNIRYPFPDDPPYVPKENPCGAYLYDFTYQKDAAAPRAFLNFEGVASCFYVWLNGQFVGYSQVAHSTSEFDVTKFLQDGTNHLAVLVLKWCDGSYMEDQDMFRMNGIFRDVYLLHRPEQCIEDYFITTDIHGSTAGVAVRLRYYDSAVATRITLYDAAGTMVGSVTPVEAPDDAAFPYHAEITVVDPTLWNAEQPYLYTLVLDTPNETITDRVGIREVHVANNQIYVNGQSIKFHGVNRHESDPVTGYAVGFEQTKKDLLMIKKHNFNAIRTSHYPDVPYFYQLCDQYGFFVIDEADNESHGASEYYCEGNESWPNHVENWNKPIADNPEFTEATVDRTRLCVERDKNRPCVIIWSMGNEAGMGPNFEACYRWIKEYDPSRPVHYERAVYDQDGAFTDIICPMYWGYEQCEKYARNNPSKPLIQCEYAHAMGNSMGGLDHYWELVRKYPSYQGGFIWDFVDQGLVRYEPDGRVSFLYGGDFNDYDATDNSFNCNGIIAPDRTWHPHAYEVQCQYQSIWTTPVDLARGRVEVYNENFFIGLDAYEMEWQLLADGRVVKAGRIGDLDVAPQQRRAYELGFTAADFCPQAKEILVNVAYKLKEKQPLLDIGHTAARQQFVVREYDCKAGFGLAASARPVEVTRWERGVRVEGDTWQMFFSRDGFLAAYTVDGRELMAEGAELRPQFWRAPTENDLGAKLHQRQAVWKNPELRLTKFDAAVEDGVAVVEALYELPAVKATLALTYRINGAGEMEVSERMTADKTAEVPNLFRFGMTLTMPARYDRVVYYGRGAHENYADRLSSADLGLYEQRVADQYHDEYVRPQESGTKGGLRWWTVADSAGTGLTILADAPFSASALPYATADLDVSNFPPQQHSGTLVARDATFVNFDLLQSGLGCIDSWGALPEKQFRVPYGDYTFRFMLKPTVK